MKITRLAALCLLAATACGRPGAGTSATPTPADSTPADAVIVDKDQVLTCGEGEGEGSAQALCDAIAAAVSPEPGSPAAPATGSPEPASPAPPEERPAPTPSVSRTFLSWVLKKGQPSPLPNPGSGPGDPDALASCRKFSSALGPSMSVKPFPVPPLGSRSWAFRVFDEKSVTQWVEVVQTPRYVLEIRIPRRWPKPRTDPAVLLPRIAAAAYARAEAALG